MICVTKPYSTDLYKTITMKKSLLFVSLAILVLGNACKKDEESDPYKAPYTTETVEQSKTNVEQNAVALVDQLDAMTDANGMKVMQHLYDLETGTPVKSTLKSPIIAPLALIRDLNAKGFSNVVRQLKSTSEAFDQDPVSFNAMFDSIAGRYTYNFVSGEFDRTDLADKVVIEFPGLEGDLTNTAVITAENFSVAEISDPGDNWPSQLAPELPASLSVTLTYNGTKLAGFSLSASYKSDGMPTKIKTEMYVDDFKLTTTLQHSPYSSASFTNTLTFKGDILLETYLAAEGNWSQENIDNSKEETTYTDDWGYQWTETQTHIEEIIKNANAHVILMNLMVAGDVNVKVLGDSIWAIDDRRDEITDQQEAQAIVDAINANSKLVVIYRDSNTKIAEAEAYVAEYDDGFGGINYEPAMRFVYADGSKVDMETYVNTELDSFYSSLNDFIDKLNAEYGLDLGPVGPGK
jgi:hypothetical protein